MKRIKDIIVKGSFFAVLSAVFCMGGIPAAPIKSTALDAVQWSGNITYDDPCTINETVTLSADTILTVADGKTLTIKNTIDCDEYTLTVAGPGTVIVEGKNEPGVKGNITMIGGTLNVTGGTDGIAGCCGILGNVDQTGGTLTVIGGAGSSDSGPGIAGSVKLTDGLLNAVGGEGGPYGGPGIFGSVSLNGGTLTAIGGESENYGGQGIWGNVTLNSGTIKAIGGTGSNPGAAFYEGVQIADGKFFTVDGAKFYTGTLSDDDKKAIAGKFLTSCPAAIGENFYPTVQDAIDAANPGDTVKLLTDVETYSSVTVSKNCILDLNGHVIEAKYAFYYMAIYILPSGDLTLIDSSDAKTGLITGVNQEHGRGGGVCVNEGDFTMKGGTISGNNALYGGGVYVYNGTFTMDGGTINGNNADLGGGVFVDEGTFIMKDGTINGNSANQEGCGVFVHQSAFKISGGTILDNKKRSGRVQNACLGKEAIITISGILDEATSVGIMTGNAPTAESPVKITSGWNTYMKGKDPSPYFKSDDPRFLLALNGDGEAELRVVVYSVNVKNGNGSGSYIEGENVTIKADAPEEGKVFDGWTSKDGVAFADPALPETTFVMPGHDVTVTATYKDKEKKEDDPDPDPDPDKPAQEKTPEKVPVSDPASSYASPEDNFAPVAPGSSGGTGGSITKLKLDFSKVKGSGVAPDSLKMTVIKGSKLTTVSRIAEGGKVEKSRGVKVKVNRKKRTAAITCKSSGWAKLPMEDGVTYTVNFTVDKPKAKKFKLKAGSGQVIKTIQELFNTDIDSGTLTAKSKKNASKAEVSANKVLVINPDGKDTIKVQYKYLNKKYKMNIKVK